MKDDHGNRPVRPVRTYASLDAAYKHFNRHLFGGLLPSCIITLQRHKGAYGYFVAERMAELDDGEDRAVDEIALNPAGFEGRSPKEILSTLVHEMAHLWQHYYGTPSRGRYHNAEWAAKMKVVGLIPSSTGRPGGRETGQKVTHYIDSDGPYARAYARLEQPADPLQGRARRRRVDHPEEEGGEQVEIHLPGMRGQCLGEARHESHLRGLLGRGDRRGPGRRRGRQRARVSFSTRLSPNLGPTGLVSSAQQKGPSPRSATPAAK
jgi:hypothetical protein